MSPTKVVSGRRRHEGGNIFTPPGAVVTLETSRELVPTALLWQPRDKPAGQMREPDERTRTPVFDPTPSYSQWYWFGFSTAVALGSHGEKEEHKNGGREEGKYILEVEVEVEADTWSLRHQVNRWAPANPEGGDERRVTCEIPPISTRSTADLCDRVQYPGAHQLY
ncbi:hypothetical protein P154DRAFT_538689 [Amniculicola lignicola CBS 123094]|uniref:Uncharacterized protein n=1 Tax=Amniculicola lignicola CBS 123094 TaxID=1392246 RepID=A0A6A5W8V4_9PLEO|nr:hypothetical protein P154DRAFT_538689 [Amniculicola lignicola CBS 123094]